MNMHVDLLSRATTIGDLRQMGGKLEFLCTRCSVARVFDPSTLPFGDAQLITTVHRRMRCSTCGWSGEGSISRTAYSSALTRPLSQSSIGRAAFTAR